MASPRRIAPGHWKFGDWDIYYEPKPIPSQSFDWNFVHTSYDGPEDKRCGTGVDVADCLVQIQEMESA